MPLLLLSGLLCPSARLPGPDPCLIQEAFLNSPPGAGPFYALPVDTFFLLRLPRSISLYVFLPAKVRNYLSFRSVSPELAHRYVKGC